jgi:2-dehydropantoate 2-reductase
VRYIVYGAGAVGGSIGGRLAEAGRETVLIARGPHLEAIRSRGLRIISPDGESRVLVDVVASPAEAGPEPGDVVFLTTKTEGTEAAVHELDCLVEPGLAVVCAQNGVDNERMVLRRGFDTYAMCVHMAAVHVEPGIVRIHTGPVGGVLDLGRYPKGSDATAEAIAADLRSASFDARADDNVMRWKYAKLLGNIGNALDAACGPQGRESSLFARARTEAMACYQAAGIDVANAAEAADRYASMPRLRHAGGMRHPGSSSWQSLARRSGRIEADWLNGEISLLGRLHGVPTPVNDALRGLANRWTREQVPPGSLAIDEVEAQIAARAARAAGPATPPPHDGDGHSARAGRMTLSP